MLRWRLLRVGLFCDASRSLSRTRAFQDERHAPVAADTGLGPSPRRRVEQTEFYFHMYRGYLSRLLTTGTLARNNDWFDLEILLYSAADDHVVVTTDKKWPSITLDEGVNHRIVHLRT